MTPADFKTEAAQVHAQLRDQSVRLRAILDDSRWRLFGSVIGAVVGTLKVFDSSLLLLGPDGAATARVISGEKSAAWWEEQAQTLRESIAYVAKTLGESVPSWRRVVGEIIKPTATELIDDVKEGVGAVGSVLPWWAPWAAGAALVVFGLWMARPYLAFLPKPKGA